MRSIGFGASGMFSLDRRVSLGDESGQVFGAASVQDMSTSGCAAPRARSVHALTADGGMTMRMTDASGILGELKAKRTINAAGNMTLLGGSMLSSEVQAAMAEANETFVDMEELLDKSGKAIAEILGAEAALVTSGCFAALALGTAALMADKNADSIARLPDTTGMRNEVLIQKSTRYHYDRAVTVPGAKLVEVGDQSRVTVDQLEAAIGPKTAGILYPARWERAEGVLSIPEVVSSARKKGVAVLIDAAAEIYPLDRMTWLASKSGAHLICFGAKYFGSLNSTGIICGKRESVEAAVLNNFMAFETRDNRSLGRGYKVDRQEIVATLVALREWFGMDHKKRFALQERRLQTIAQALEGLPYVKTERIQPRQGAWTFLRVICDEARSGKSLASVCAMLREGDPSVRVRLEEGEIRIAAHTLKEGEDEIVAGRMRRVLSA
jgi:D-glucosaminate-6-phosphate ammonia-lyase